MAYPTDLETLATDRSNTTDVVDTHPADHNNENRLINALQAKVGADSSAVTTSHDYKLGEVTGSDKAVGKTASQTLTNKTLTAPVISTISNTGTLTLPTSTDTLVGRDTSDTLTNKTLTTPTIGSFTNATHTHQDNAGGGQLNATSVFSAGTVPTARLGSGSASSSTFLRGDSTWVSSVISFYCGDGSDENATISAPTTLTRDMYYNDLVINDTLTTDGYLVFVKGTVSGSGTLTWGTANAGGGGGNSVVSGTSTAGSAAAASGSGKLRNLGGATGGNNASGGSSGSAGSSVAAASHTIGGANVAGGNGAQDGGSVNSGGIGGSTIRTPSVDTKIGVFSFPTFKMFDVSDSGTFTPYVAGFGGNGGGGGASRSTDSGAGGGGGGASGGIVALFATTWNGTFTIQAKGGAGGAGGNGTSGSFGGGAGGGGAGGAGGYALIVYGSKGWTGSYDIGGGAGGAAGTGSSNAATAGTAGAAGISKEIDITTLTR